LPVEVLLASIPSLPRVALNRLIEQAIDRLDADDGDADLDQTVTRRTAVTGRTRRYTCTAMPIVTAPVAQSATAIAALMTKGRTIAQVTAEQDRD
jgi:hypothetical protein